MVHLRKLYSILALDDAHCALISRIATASDKSNEALLSMMMRKNRQIHQSISNYSTIYKIKHEKPKTSLPKVKVPSLMSKIVKQRTLRISLDNQDYKASNQMHKTRQLSSLSTPKKKPFQHKEKQPVRAQSKLSIIEFPTFGTELQLSSSSKKPSLEHFGRRQLSSLCNINFNEFCKCPPLLSPTILSSHEQQLLLDQFDCAYKPNPQKENKPNHIRVRTFKSFQQYDSTRIGTSRPSYLKPVPVESFFTKFQSESASRGELIQARGILKKIK